jgi:hypothetical protein
LESVLEPLAAFQKGFVKIWEIIQPIGRKGSKFKREWCMHSLFSKEF